MSELVKLAARFRLAASLPKNFGKRHEFSSTGILIEVPALERSGISASRLVEGREEHSELSKRIDKICLL
jgi:hypothetical protein